MCRTKCLKTQKCVTHQQRMGEQSRISAWPDGKVLKKPVTTSSQMPAHQLDPVKYQTTALRHASSAST
jgi:hypothetical protein